MATQADLEQRACAGDREAQFELGARLLARPDSLETFATGAGFVEAAAAQRHAEATCLLATMEAIGAGRPQDWGRAFEQLRLAAELGSERAAAQQELLGGRDKPLDIATLLNVPPHRALSERPWIRVFEGFASPAECRWVIAGARPALAPAMIWDEASGLGKVDPLRTGSAVELWLTGMDMVTQVLRARIAVAAGVSELTFELPQVMHYSVGEEFAPHHDYLDPDGLAPEIARDGQRIATFLICLNEDFDGGETEFPEAGLSYRGRVGDALFFANVLSDGQPDPLTVHAGRPPTSGEKWIFSQWIRDRAPG